MWLVATILDSVMLENSVVLEKTFSSQLLHWQKQRYQNSCFQLFLLPSSSKILIVFLHTKDNDTLKT